MRKLIFVMLLMLLTSATAGAGTIVDDESANDLIETAEIQIPCEANSSAYVGDFSLMPEDVDFVGLGPLVAGDVITAATTPLEGSGFSAPDTLLGVFDAAGNRLAFNDDAGGLTPGSALAFEVLAAGDYFVATTGYGDPAFEGFHNKSGSYALTISLVPVSAPNTPPDCSTAVATPEELWPLDHKMADVSIAGITDPDGDPVALTITSIFQDEPLVNSHGTESCGDGAGVGTEMASVRAASNGAGDGRVYSIGFTAMDDGGEECSGTVAVCVPHDRGGNDTCVDQGPLFDSTDCDS
ncbi:MAG: hypothetical protein JRJ05_02515 [Deltaproteobacteria bacterium]|nr:hypothetical protein [Deltaproteobacteria bacterium]